MLGKIKLKIKKWVYYHFNVFSLRGKKAIQKVEDTTSCLEKSYPNSEMRIAITKEAWHLHYFYIKACQELKISYKIVDLFSYRWQEELLEENFDFILFRPSVQYSPWKDMFDNRLGMLEISTPIYPNSKALWLWESKLRTLDWMQYNKIPHPKSYIFYNQEEVIEFGRQSAFPVVYKSNMGSGASGVRILYSLSELKSTAKKCFSKGIRTYRKHKLDVEHGSLILQEYHPNVKEWRIIRTGDYYVGYEKLKKGQFHSGSQEFGYGMPPKEALDLVRNITNKYNFLFVDIDVFVTEEGDFLINEIQPYFGQKGDRELLVIDGESGALHFDYKQEKWCFTKGKFCRNNMANLRLLELIKMKKSQ